jgi:hypothetical protein
MRRLELVATIAGLDLAKILFQQGKLDPLYRLVRELRVAAEAHQLPGSVGRALAILEVLCQVQNVTLAMMEAVQRFFQRLQHNPRLSWDPELILLR